MTVRKQIETQNLYTGSSDSLTFPLTRDLTHDLGDGRGETLLSQGFAKGAAVAYSLRALGSYNEPVVRVRREPHDEDQAINDEQNFTASQVSGGELENWVNGKLETTLPADVDTAAATYSLRKAKADYSGDAVRIRRTSDSVEVNVALDSDDKVSASSAITNTTEQGGESGETNATTVAEFLSEERTTFVTNPVFSVSGGGGSITQEVTNTSASFSFQGGTNNFIRDARKPANLGAETGDTISFDVTASGVSTDFSVRLRVVGANTEIISPPINDLNNGTRTITLTVGSNSPAGYFAFTNLNTASTGTVTIDNIKVVGKSATVHTWYDQAGSNNAVQDTADNQPKIAENGALLADGIDFDGINDNFTITNGVSGRSIFAVTNQNIDTTGGGLSGYGQDGISSLLGTAGTNSYIFVSNNNSAFNSYAISIDGAVSDSGQYASNGKTLSSAGGNLGTYGDIPSDTNSLLSIIYGSGDPSNDWTRLGSGINDNIFMQGSMSELILYSSDQSANRFKIESNINNYYGLYNDANELTQTEWQNTGAESFSSTSTDGFSYSNSSSTSFVGVTLSETLPLNDSVFVSFNASGVTHPASSDQSPQIRLRDSISGGSATSDINQVTNGFNAYTLTYNTGSSGQHIVFSEGDTAGGTVTISDFKVSRIARNGFVETWYDQSGNGNDAVQASAGNQPAIVQNGGLVTDGIRFETDNELETGGNITASTITGFVVANLKGTNANSLYSLGSDSSAAPSILFGNPSLSYVINGGTPLSGGTAPTFANSLFTQLFISGGTSKSFIDGSQIASGDAGSNTASSGKITIGNLASSTRYANIAMNELIVFISDKSTDQDEIEKDIANFYNITLS